MSSCLVVVELGPMWQRGVLAGAPCGIVVVELHTMWDCCDRAMAQVVVVVELGPTWQRGDGPYGDILYTKHLQ